jgi:hypothetical protein
MRVARSSSMATTTLILCLAGIVFALLVLRTP